MVSNIVGSKALVVGGAEASSSLQQPTGAKIDRYSTETPKSLVVSWLRSLLPVPVGNMSITGKCLVTSCISCLGVLVVSYIGVELLSTSRWRHWVECDVWEDLLWVRTNCSISVLRVWLIECMILLLLSRELSSWLRKCWLSRRTKEVRTEESCHTVWGCWEYAWGWDFWWYHIIVLLVGGWWC